MALHRLRSRKRTLLALAAACLAGGAITFLGNVPAFAVHDLNFQLDGDVSAATTTSVGGHTQGVDWDSLFTSAGANQSPLPANFTAAKFSKDFSNNGSTFVTSDPTTYTTGSKDTLPISGWQCTFANNVNSKIDIMNAYSAAYTDPTSGDQVLYFALERNSNAGDGNVAFWFLQDNVGCTAPSGTVTFSGQHMDGDLLIVSAFTNGGSVSTIDVYRWNRPGNPANDPGSLGTTPVAHGVDCKSTGGNDTACATVNGPTNGTAGTISTPWLTSNKNQGVGHSLQESEFFEGGLDLTKANLGGHCFNVFTGDTRSSQSLTATLFDYALGTLGECTSTTTTVPKDSSGNTLSSVQIPTSGSVTVHDSATVTVTGVPSFTGTVSFHLCGPSALNSTATCDTGGVDLGSSNITTNGTYDSANAVVSSVGRYCFRAEFAETGNAGIPPSSDHSATECFTVTPVTPHITTQAGSSPVDFGNPVTDTGTLSGTANEPGNPVINPTTAGGPAQGTITFTLFKNNCTTVATGTGTNPQTVNVTGDGTYGPVSFTPDAPGTYHWVASYSGDSPNTNASPASDSVCGADPNEDVVVRQIPTALRTKQSWFPNDTATVKSTISGTNLGAGGSVVFNLYATSDCTGAVQYTETKTVTGGTQTEQLGTNNTTVNIATMYADPPASTVTYSWKVTYTPSASDTAHTGSTSQCETFTTSYTNDPGPTGTF